MRLIVDFFAANIVMKRQHGRMVFCCCRGLIPVVFENIMDQSVADAGNLQSNTTSSFEPAGAILFLKPDDAKASIKALLNKGF